MNDVEEFNEQKAMARFRAGITRDGLTFNKAPEFMFQDATVKSESDAKNQAPGKTYSQRDTATK